MDAKSKEKRAFIKRSKTKKIGVWAGILYREG
jgi:hypothetical protein